MTSSAGKRPARDPDADSMPPLAHDMVDMPGDQGDAGLGRRRTTQDFLEHDSSAQQCGRPRGLLRRGHRSAARDQLVEHIRHLDLQRLHDLAAKRVWVMKLHDALAVPSVRRMALRPRVAIDHDDVASALRQRDRGEQAGRTRPDDHSSHEYSRLR
jgi:hypothetical protein